MGTEKWIVGIKDFRFGRLSLVRYRYGLLQRDASGVLRQPRREGLQLRIE